MDPDSQDVIDRIYAMGANQTAAQQPMSTGDMVSSGFNQVATILSGYIGRRLDIDLQGRQLQTLGTVQVRSDQTPVNSQPTPNAQALQTRGDGLAAMLPLLLVGTLVFVALRGAGGN